MAGKASSEEPLEFSQVLFAEVEQIESQRRQLAEEDAQRSSQVQDGANATTAPTATQPTANIPQHPDLDQEPADEPARIKYWAEKRIQREQAERNRSRGELAGLLQPTGTGALSGASVVDGSAKAVGGRQSTPPEKEQTGAVGETPLDKVRRFARQTEAVGLAFSGGGIRSATFCLGILQGLADLGLLKRFDYLSTVSGGGYVGGWLAAWIKREGDIRTVERQLRSSRVEQAQGRPGNPTIAEEEPGPVFHLRSYSNYLAPRLGIGSLDGWTLLAVYARNLILNWCILVPLVVGLLLLPRLVLSFMKWSPLYDKHIAFGLGIAILLSLAAGLALPLLLYAFSRWLFWIRSWFCPAVRPAQNCRTARAITMSGFKWAVTPALVLACFLTSWPRFYETAEITFRYWTVPVLFCVSAALMITLASSISTWGGPDAFSRKTLRCLRESLVVVVVAVAGGVLLDLTLQYLSAAIKAASVREAHAGAITLAVAPAVCLALLALAASVHVGIMGDWLNEAQREWWATACGALLVWAATSGGVVGASLFSIPFLHWVGPVVCTALGTSWAATSIGGFLAGRSPRTGGPKKSLSLEALARVAPYVFVVGFLIATSAVLSLCLDRTSCPVTRQILATRTALPTPATQVRKTTALETSHPGTTRTDASTEETHRAKVANWRYWEGVASSTWLSLLRWLFGCSVIPLFFCWCIGVNTFSLLRMYQNRLVRCYLGASRPKTNATGGVACNSAPPPRNANPITGFDPADDLQLHTLRTSVGQTTDGTLYSGPYLLVNTAMNLVSADELAWQERKAEAFLFSPRYYGSEGTGYIDTAKDPFSLGEVMAVSGAAVSPNMGYHSSPAVTALLVFLNVRLGAWIDNPNRVATWGRQWPWLTLRALLSELFGWTNRRSRYVYLSDGGHFENLGVYELVRRHCRYIVAVDAGEDGQYAFGDLGNMIRKCQTDLGVPIEIDFAPLQPQAEGSRSRRHCAIGRIRYDKVDPQAVPGTLVYIKSSLTGNEPADVLNYAAEHPDFPHQPTMDQFFAESQFESYRALGHHVAHEVFDEPMRDMADRDDTTETARRTIVRRLFSGFRRRWCGATPAIEEILAKSGGEHLDLQEDLRTDGNLRQLSLTLYPELENTLRSRQITADTLVDRRRSEFYAVQKRLQIMERIWLRMRLEDLHAHPINRGLLTVFRRWASSGVLNEYWCVLRGEFNPGFVRFCEVELQLGREKPQRTSALLDPNARHPAWDDLAEDFRREWPQEADTLPQRVDAARNLRRQHQIDSLWQVGRLFSTNADTGRRAVAEYLVGFGLVCEAPENQHDYELLVWIRPPYRSQEIGHTCFDESFFETLIQSLRRLPNHRSHLRVRYPHAGTSESANRIEKTIWQDFFHSYGFRPEKRDPLCPSRDLVMRLSLS